MADFLKLVLEREVAVNALILWLTGNKENVELPHQLSDSNRLRSEFVPFFLNYLRDQTLPLLQNGKSVTPSPVKTPSGQKLKSTPGSQSRALPSANRVQLFSPSERQDLPSPSSASLDTSLNSPKLPKTPTERNNRYITGQEIRNKNREHRHSPLTSRQMYQKSSVDPNKSKHRISLGDFLTSPNEGQNSRKKRSPQVGGRKDRCQDESQSPSPISYRQSDGKKRQQLHTVEHLTRRQKDKSGEVEEKKPVFSLCNADDFPPIGGGSGASASVNSNETVKPTRRINPTRVTTETKRPQNAAFMEVSKVMLESSPKSLLSENSTVAGQSVFGGSGDGQLSLEFERALLRKERVKWQELKSGSGDAGQGSLSAITPTKAKALLERKAGMVESVVAVRSEVTHQNQLSLLAALYSSCIHENLLPNLNVELYFLIQLLTIKEMSEEDFNPDPDEVNYFSTVHNAVFFAVQVLEKQYRLLVLLERSTVRLLADNARVADFSPTLGLQLNEAQEMAKSQAVSVFPRSPIGGVSFQADTDNRKNFPNDRSFLQFKKQRDLFYELLRIWEENHMTPGWSMVDTLGERIRSLVRTRTELANHIHLTCKGDQTFKSEGDEENIAFLSQLKKTNPEKFHRLQERFTTPMTIGGPCPPPTFPGCQEFYRDFITAASCHTFNQHLIDTFSAKISELDSIELSEMDVETEEGQTERVLDEEDRETFSTSLLAARLVAKFLGYVTFLPYQTVERLPESVLSTYLELRTKVTLPLNVLDCVECAHRQGRLVFTLPWVVEFLSMMDLLSPLLDYFQTLLTTLLQIYRYAVQKMKYDKTEYNRLLIVFMLGWLFQLPTLPEGFFFQGFPELSRCTPQSSPSNKVLDTLKLIDQPTLYACCPYLVEVRSLLLDFAVGNSNKNMTIRKITPVAADDLPSQSVTEKQLQLHMEENFFHNHPASLKRVVEFVAERTASNYIKKFRSSTLTQSFNSGREAVVKLVTALAGVSPNIRTKEKLSQDVKKSAQVVSELARNEALQNVHEFCQKKIEDLVLLLLPEEQMEAVVAMAICISCRQAEERVGQWLNNHITTRIFQREMSDELEKLCRPVNLQKMNQSSVDMTVTDTSITEGQGEGHTEVTSIHDDNRKGPTEVLTETKMYVRDLVLRKEAPIEERALACMQQVCDTLAFRQDLLPEGYRSFAMMLQDISLSFICWAPQSWTRVLCEKCLSMWKGSLRDHLKFDSLLSTRLLHWINKSPNQQSSWACLRDLVQQLLTHGLIKPQQIEKWALSILTLAQSLGMFESLADVLLSLIQCHQNNNGEIEEMSELVDLLHHLLDKPSMLQELETLTLTNIKLKSTPDTNPASGGGDHAGVPLDNSLESLSLGTGVDSPSIDQAVRLPSSGRDTLILSS